jgi:hypothetical protein
MQGALSTKEYSEAMMDRIDNIPEGWLKALEEIERGKRMVAKAYNKRVWAKSFQIGELGWKMILRGHMIENLESGYQVGRDYSR